MNTNFERAVAVAEMVQRVGQPFGVIGGDASLYAFDGHAYTVLGGLGFDEGDFFEFVGSIRSRGLDIVWA